MGRFSRIFFCSAILMFAALTAGAQKNSDFDPATASIEENIRHPQVQEKYVKALVALMTELKDRLKAAGFSASQVRSGEVVLVTIPCSSLFAPNETKLSAKGASKLAELKPFILKQPDFKIILAAHSDNTGDETYADRLTADRANAVDEYFFKENGNRETGIIPYGIGADEPVADNHGYANRAKNRRVEFYFVPTAEFINKVRKNK